MFIAEIVEHPGRAKRLLKCNNVEALPVLPAPHGRAPSSPFAHPQSQL